MTKDQQAAVFAWVMFGLLAWYWLRSYRQTKVRDKLGLIKRSKEPWRYWLQMGLIAFFALAIAFPAIELTFLEDVFGLFR